MGNSIQSIPGTIQSESDENLRTQLDPDNNIFFAVPPDVSKLLDAPKSETTNVPIMKSLEQQSILDDKFKKSLAEAYKSELCVGLETRRLDNINSETFWEMIHQFQNSLDEGSWIHNHTELATIFDNLIGIYRAFLRELERTRRHKEEIQVEQLEVPPAPVQSASMKFLIRSILILIRSSARNGDAEVAKELKILSRELLEMLEIGELQGQIAPKDLEDTIMIVKEVFSDTSLALDLGLALVRGDIGELLSIAAQMYTLPAISMQVVEECKDSLVKLGTFCRNGTHREFAFKTESAQLKYSNGLRTVQCQSIQKVEVKVKCTPIATLGRYFVQFKLENDASSCFKIGLISENTSEKFAINYKSSGVVEPFEGSISSYGSGASIGMLIDHLSGKLAFYNGTNKEKEYKLPDIPLQVYLNLQNNDKVTIPEEIEAPELPKGTVILNKQRELQVDLSELEAADVSTAPKVISKLILNELNILSERFLQASKELKLSRNLSKKLFIIQLTDNNFEAICNLIENGMNDDNILLNSLKYLQVQLLAYTSLELDSKIISQENRERLFNLLEQVQNSKVGEVKEAAAKCIPYGFSLFYATSDQQLNTIAETIRNNTEDNKYLTEAILARFSKISEFSSLLKDCSEESVNILKDALVPLVQQSFTSNEKEKSEFIWTCVRCILALFPDNSDKFANILTELVLSFIDEMIMTLNFFGRVEAEQANEALQHAGMLNVILFTMSNFELNIETLNKLAHKIYELHGIASNIKLDGLDVIYKNSEQVFESKHPYPEDDSKTHKITSENPILKAVFKFDEESKLAEGTTLKIKNRGWEQIALPLENLGTHELETPEDIEITFVSQSNAEWGYKVTVTLVNEIKDQIKKQKDHLLLALETFMLMSAYNLTKSEMSESETSKFLDNPLLRNGISESAWSALEATFEIKPELKELALAIQGEQQIEDAPPAGLARSQSVRVPGKQTIIPTQSGKAGIDQYLRKIENQKQAQILKSLFLEQFINGKGNTESLWNAFRSESGLALNNFARLGGEEVNKVERATFCVFVKLRGLEQTLEHLNTDEPIPQQIIEIAKESFKIRIWLVNIKQKGDDIEEACKNAFNRIVLLLNASYQTTLDMLGVSNQEKLVRSSSLGHDEVEVAHSPYLPKEEGQRVIMNLVMKRVMSISGKPVKRKPKEELSPLAQLVEEYIKDTSVTFDQLKEEINNRREAAIKRATGLLIFSRAISQFQNVWLSAQLFNQAFKIEKGKTHFLQGLEGIDRNLSQCVQSNFLSCVQGLLLQLQNTLSGSKTWSSDKNAATILKLFAAISCSFKQTDSQLVLALELHRAFNSLLNIVKRKVRIDYNEQVDLDKCITSFKLSSLAEKDFVPLGNNIYINGVKGGKEPICEAIISAEAFGMVKVTPNLATEENPKYLFVKYGNGHKLLTKIDEDSENQLSFTFQSRSQVAKQDNERNEKIVGELANSAWLLLKTFIYSLAASPHESWQKQSDSAAQRLNEILLSMLTEQLRFTYDKESEVPKDMIHLQIQDAVKGLKWTPDKIVPPSNIMIVEYLYEQTIGKSQFLNSLIDLYLKSDVWRNGKPIPIKTVKATLKMSNIEIEIQDSWLNLHGQFDLFHIFRLLKTDESAPMDAIDFLLTNRIIEMLPASMNDTIEWSIQYANLTEFVNSVAEKLPEGPLRTTLNEMSQAKGVVDTKKVKEHLNKLENSWINTDGKVDFFLMINQLWNSSSDLSDLIHSVIDADTIKTLPPQVLFLQKPEDNQASIEFIRSLLWVIHLCSLSKTARYILSENKYLKLFFEISFSLRNSSLAIYGLKILRKLLPEKKQLKEVDAILSSVDISELNQIHTFKAKPGILSILSTTAGLHFTYTLDWGSKANFPIKYALEMECREILGELLNSSDWFEILMDDFEQTVNDLLEVIQTPNALLDQLPIIKQHYLTVLGYISILSRNTPNFGLKKEWSLVNLTQASFARGVLYETQPDCIIMSMDQKKPETISLDQIEESYHDINTKLEEWTPQSAMRVWEVLLILIQISRTIKKSQIELSGVLLTHQQVAQTLELHCIHLISLIFTKVSDNVDYNTFVENLYPYLQVNNLQQDLDLNIDCIEKLLVTKIQNLPKPSIFSSVNVEAEENEAQEEEVVNEDEKQQEIEEEEKEQPVNILFNLSAKSYSDFQLRSNNSEVGALMNSSSHLALISPKEINGVYLHHKFDHNLFHNVLKKQFCLSLTCMIALGTDSEKIDSTIGFSLGQLQIILMPQEDSINITSLFSGQETLLFSGENSSYFTLKLYILANSTVEILVNGNSNILTECPIFDGYQLQEFKLMLIHGKSCVLRGFTIFEDKLTKDVSFFNTEQMSFDNFTISDRVANIRQGSTQNIKTKILEAIGASNVEELDNISAFELADRLKNPIEVKLDSEVGDPIVDVILVDGLDQVDPGFQVVRYVIDGQDVGPIKIEGLKVLAYKTLPIQQCTQVVSGIDILKSEKSAQGGLVGDLGFITNEEVKDSQEKQKSYIYITYTEVESVKNYLTDLILIKSTNLGNTYIPDNFEAVLELKGTAISFPGTFPVLNLTDSKEEAIFIAMNNKNSLNGVPIKELGRVNLPQDPVDQSKQDKVKAIGTNIVPLNMLQLKIMIRDAYQQDIANTVARLILQMTVKQPGLISPLLQIPQDVLTLLQLFELQPTFKEAVNQLLDTPETSAIFKEKIISLLLGQLLLHLSKREATGQVNPLIVESIHPYENNMRHNQTIQIPGATALQIEFLEPTYTESGCDRLSFYRRPGNQDQICEYSGDFSNFKNFRVESDTVFLHFYTDGSVIYWGYKFRVTPIANSTSYIPANHYDHEHYKVSAIETLLKIVASRPDLIEMLAQNSAYKNLILLASHANNYEIRNHIIEIINSIAFKDAIQIEKVDPVKEGDPKEVVLSKYLVKDNQSSQIWISEDYYKLFSKEFFLINAKEKNSSGNFYQTYCNLLSFYPKCTEKSISSLVDISLSIEGFAFQNYKLTIYLLRQFIKQNVDIFKQTLQIKPYLNTTQVQPITFNNNSEFNVLITEVSKLELHHSFILTYDEQGDEIIPASPGAMSEQNCTFNPNQIGTSLELKNNNQSVVRQSSNGSWSCAMVNVEFYDGVFEIEFKCDKLTSNSDAFVGINGIQDSYGLTSCALPGNGMAEKSITYRLNGDFYNAQGSCTNYLGLKTRDVIKFQGDFDSLKGRVFVNGQKVADFDLDQQKYGAHVCLGCTEKQKITIQSLRTNQSSLDSIKSTSYQVRSSLAYLHYPINKNWFKMRNFQWEHNRSPILVHDLDEAKSYFSNNHIKNGKFYFSISIRNFMDANISAGIMSYNKDSKDPMGNKSYYIISKDGTISSAGQQFKSQELRNGDCLAFEIDTTQNSLVYYKNGIEIHRCVYQVKKSAPFHAPGVYLTKKGQRVILGMEGADRDYKYLNDPGESREKGLSFELTPLIRTPSSISLLKDLDYSVVKQWDDYASKFFHPSLHYVLSDVVQLVDHFCIKENKDPLNLTEDELQLNDEQLLQYIYLEKLTHTEIKQKFKAVQEFNSEFVKIMGKISIQGECDSSEYSIQSAVLKCRPFIFFNSKMASFKDSLKETQTEERPSVTIDKINATILSSRGEKDSECQFSVFAQVMKVMHALSNKSLRNPERAFVTHFRAEGATDAGGPYNETISQICDELMSDFLPLFIPSSNKKNDMGQNRDTFVLNPSADSPKHYEMFTFLGKLFGIAIRTQNNMKLMLPPIFWKKVTQTGITHKDLKDVDTSAYQAIELLKNLESQGIGPAEFPQMFQDLCFATADSSDRIVELKPKGKTIPVSFEDAKEYASLVENFRLHENDEAYNCIRRGMECVVPITLLNLFTWKQIETLVCGAPEIDVERLKDNTIYDGPYNAEHRVIIMFWEVLTEMTNDERVSFLRFVWGRSRLPATGAFKQFTIERYHSETPDKYLPISHTCFFSLELPEYNSKDIMRAKILYACSHCQAIDLDYMPGEEADGELEE